MTYASPPAKTHPARRNRPAHPADHTYLDKRFAFLTPSERSFLPAIEGALEEFRDDPPLVMAREMLGSFYAGAVPEYPFKNYYHQWMARGATREMIAAACTLLATHPRRYHPLNAVHMLMTAFAQRMAGLTLNKPEKP